MNVRKFSLAFGLGLVLSAGFSGGVFAALSASDIGNLLNLDEEDAAKVCNLACNRGVAMVGPQIVLTECLACKKNVDNFQSALVTRMKSMTKKGAKVDKKWIKEVCEKAKDAGSPAFANLRQTCDSKEVQDALSKSGDLMAD